MKKRFGIDCQTVMDAVYNSEGANSLPVLVQARIKLHVLFCSVCAGELKDLRRLEEVMKSGFFPPSPEFEGLIMERLHNEAYLNETFLEETDAPAGFTFRGWVITGFFILLSLGSSFFGVNFIQVARAEGLSFLLPVGLTVGIVVTGYVLFFIASHLKELSTRFRLR